MFTKILVCISSIEFPEKLIDCITYLVKENGGSVILTKIKNTAPPSVAENPSSQFPMVLSSGAFRMMEKDDNGLQSRIQELFFKLSELGIIVEQTSNKGISTNDIARFAREIGVDLIVMTTQAYKGWKRLVLGSNIENVLRESSIPILVFNPDNFVTTATSV